MIKNKRIWDWLYVCSAIARHSTEIQFKSVITMSCAGQLWIGLFSSSLKEVRKVNIFYTCLWSAASQSVGHFLATCILAARAPNMELSSLVIALCDHQQKLRQQFQLITNTTLLFDWYVDCVDKVSFPGIKPACPDRVTVRDDYICTASPSRLVSS